MAPVRWTKQSVEDLDQIAEYISKDSRYYAIVQTEKFFNAVKILGYQVEAGRKVPEIGDESIREIIVGNYRIIYKVVNQDRADILTVHHSRRDIKGNKGLISMI